MPRVYCQMLDCIYNEKGACDKDEIVIDEVGECKSSDEKT